MNQQLFLFSVWHTVCVALSMRNDDFLTINYVCTLYSTNIFIGSFVKTTWKMSENILILVLNEVFELKPKTVNMRIFQILTKIWTSEIKCCDVPWCYRAIFEFLQMSRILPGPPGHDVTTLRVRWFSWFVMTFAIIKYLSPWKRGLRPPSPCAAWSAPSLPTRVVQIDRKCRLPAAMDWPLNCE